MLLDLRLNETLFQIEKLKNKLEPSVFQSQPTV